MEDTTEQKTKDVQEKQAVATTAAPSKKTMSRKRIALLVLILAVVFGGAFLYDRYVYNNKPVTQLNTPSFDGNKTQTAAEQSD